MRNPFKRVGKALTGSSEMLDALRGGWVPIPLLGGGSRQRIQDVYNTAQSANYSWIYQNSPAVRTVVDVIVRNVGQLDLRLYEEISESERQPRPDHPAALSMRYPSESTTADSLVRSLFKDYLLFNNAYAVMAAGVGNRISVNWVPAHMVEVQGQSLFSADNYRVWRVDGTWVDVPPEAMLHWRGENPRDPRVGLSPLDTLRDVIAEDAALQAATVELAQNGLQEPVWVSRPSDAPDWSNDALKGFEEDLANRLRRRNSTPPVLEEGMRLESFGVSPRDAQMYEVRRWAIERVAALYGVPLGMVGLADNIEQAQSQFYADVLPPYCEDFTSMLNLRILVRVYDWTDGCFEFNLDEKLMGDDRLKALTSATGRPVMLTNEGRAKLNLPPVDGGDELVTPANVIVGNNPKPSVDVMPIQDPNGPEQDGSYREQPKAIKAAEPAERLPQLHPGRKVELDRQHRNVDLAKGVVQRHFNRLERSLHEKAHQGIEVKAADWARLDKEFANDLNKVLQRIVDHEGGIYALKLGGHDFDMRRVEDYLRAMAEGAAGAINDTVRHEIADLGVEEAISRGSQHVASAGISLGAKATQWARMEAARQGPSPDTRVKSWIPNTARHAKFGGDTVPLGADWPAGFAPGSAPGCCCSMAIS